MQTSGIFRGIHKGSEIFNRFVLLNFFWFLLNLPVFFLIFNIFIANKNDRLFFIWMTILIMPFTFFPAMLSLFAVVRKWVIEKNTSGLSKTVRSFFKNLKKYYRKGLLYGTFFCIVWSVLGLDLYYFQHKIIWIEVLLYLMIGISFVYMINFLCVTVHYDLNWKGLYNKALLLTIGSPVQFIFIFAVYGSLLIVAYFIPIFILLAFGSLSAYLSFSIFYKRYLHAINEVH